MMNVIFRPTASLVCAHLTHLVRSLAAWPIARACLGVLIPLTAWAQPAGRDPLNAQITTPPITYQSAFSDFKTYQEPEWISWTAANEVVGELGSMGAMHGSDSPDAQAGKGEQSNQPAKPSHDMNNMNKSETPSGSKKPASPTSKPADMNSMPGHDMSKMQSPVPKTNAPQTAPAPKANDKGNMADIPGHDMSNMQRKTPSATTKPSPPSGKPAAPATMPGMSH